MSKARVAVVIPCYNDGRFLHDAIASLREQERCEVVVVDDGSNEAETITVLAELETDGVPVIHQENSGLEVARMTGLQATSARYVQPLDADDRLAPGALTVLADALDANPDAQAAWGDTRSFGRRDCHVPKAFELDPWRITYLCEIPYAGMVRRRALEGVGGWDWDTPYSDWDLWMKLAERGWRCVHVRQVTLRYREHLDPRMHVQGAARHGELKALLRARHRGLYANRRRAWRFSSSPLSIKLLFPIIERLPLLAALQKERLLVAARNVFEPHMKPDCSPDLLTLVRSIPSSLLGGRGRRKTADQHP